MVDSIIFGKSFYDAIKCLSIEERGEFITSICEDYFEDNDSYECSGAVKACVMLAKPYINKGIERRNASKENGKKGGRPKKENLKKPNNNLTKPNENPNVNVNDNVNANDNEIVPESINTRKQKEYDGTMTVETSDSNILKKKKEYYIKCFEEGCGKGLEPTVDQIIGFVVKNNVTFEKEDFELEVYQGHKVGDKYEATMKNLGLSALKKTRPMKIDYGYSFSSDTSTLQEFMKMYVESDKHQDLNIIVV